MTYIIVTVFPFTRFWWIWSYTGRYLQNNVTEPQTKENTSQLKDELKKLRIEKLKVERERDLALQDKDEALIRSGKMTRIKCLPNMSPNSF